MRFLLFLLTLSTASTVFSLAPPSKTGKYIIKLKPQADQGPILDFIKQQQRTSREGLTRKKLGKVKRRFRGSFNGFAGEFDPGFLQELKTQYGGAIERIEEDGRIRIAATQTNAPWGLVRIGVKEYKPDATFDYDYPTSAGKGVTVYVLDSGVDASHPEFEGRVTMGPSYVRNEEETDLHGHGTHCAGTIASKSYGVAKKAKVVGVKVLGRDGEGEVSDLITGIQWVLNNTEPNRFSVISMSLTRIKSKALMDQGDALDDIVNTAAKRIAMVVAAGNDFGTNSCRVSPARAAGAFTVGAIDVRDKIALFSNKGACVKVYAPGVDIPSTWPGGGMMYLNGTSMAAPHVAGAAALYLSARNFTSIDELYRVMLEKATTTSTGIKVIYNKVS